MNKNIIHKLFSHSAESGASSLVINHSKNELIFNYKFSDGHEQNFSLPGHLGSELLNDLRRMLKIPADNLKPSQNFKLKEKNYQLNFKLNIIPDQDGEKIIIQILKKNEPAWRLKQLGYQRENLKILQNIKKLHSGLVIISAPENNGKSTTLRALLKEFDLESINAYWLEKNPKQLIPGINYLSPDSDGWDRVLNHDSNLIIIDDLKSEEDLIKAIIAANSGRLVLITTNGQSSLEIILKILKLNLAPLLKINNLRAIINQRLVNLARPKKIKAKTPFLENRVQIAVSEIINFNQKIKKYLISDGTNYQKEVFWKKLNNIITENGFKPLASDLSEKIKRGSIKKI